MPTQTDRSPKRQTKTRSLEPSAIFKEIEAQPPLMRSRAARAYQGMESDWSLIFANAQEGRSGDARLYFNCEPRRMMGMISGNASLRKYPQLRRLQAGTPVRVRGTIQKVDACFIELEIRDLVFAMASEAAHCPPRQ